MAVSPPNRANAVNVRCNRSDAHPLALLPEQTAEVAELLADEAVDALTRRTNGFANVMLDALHRDAIDELAPVLLCPEGAGGTGAHRAPRAHASAAEQGSARSLAGWSAPEQ